MTQACYEDLFNMVCGEKLGKGLHRDVYACKIRPDLVVKVETDEYRYFANVLEMKFWSDHEHYQKVANWLAPCEYLSPDGRILMMRRAEPIPPSYKMPDKLPAFLTDLKRENFGFVNGVLVCVDYAMTIPNPSTRYKTVFWD